jgi:DNA (cytosine-5)-methyltransferase 1
LQRFRLYQALALQGVSPDVVTRSFQGMAGQDKALERSVRNLVKFPLLSLEGDVLAKDAKEAAGLFKELATKKHSQRALVWDKPSPTVLSIPDDFVHPSEPRTMTVRELARFQSFPDAFEFRGKETTGGIKRRTEVPQYTQVGNAVPPMLAFAVGKRLSGILEAAIASHVPAESEAA